ncbi:MAG: DUF4864 domain-containing protein [Geminicoccaceae bacterium]
MRRFLLVVAMLAAVAAGPVRAMDAADGAAIQAVIGEQMAAFKRDDGTGAFAFASPGMRQMFGDADTFMRMVRTGYQAVYRPRQVEFRDLFEEGGRTVQRVLVVGPDGVPVIARYFMQRQPDGSWRIDGCVLEKGPDVTA